MDKKYFFIGILMGFLFFLPFASAQEQGDLDAACANAMQAPTPAIQEQVCANISAQVASSAPAGVTLSCVWTGTDCVSSIVVDDSVKNPGTVSTSLTSTCAKGNGYQELCTNITASIAAAGSSPSGISVGCVWDNAGASNMCSSRITLQTSTITSKMVAGIIKSMEFIQGGAAKTSIKVMSDPFEPYMIHTVVDGSNFPGGKDSDTWMTVTATKDITPQTFNLDSIDPAAMAQAEKDKLMSQFSGAGPTEIGQGIGPDFSALKALQTFNWNMTIPYDIGKEFAGTAQCNGTFNETLDKCMNGSHDAEWIKMPLCTTLGSCPSGSYLKDVPSAGYLTIYGADPVPVYLTENETTTTSTTTSTTSTTTAACAIHGDNPPCGSISLAEVVNYINLWAGGEASLGDVVALINAWAGS